MMCDNKDFLLLLTIIQRWPNGPLIAVYVLVHHTFLVDSDVLLYKSKLVFVNFRALSHPYVDHLVQCFEGVC